MTSYYNHVYTALRSSMIDRDMGDKEEDAVLIDFKSAIVALKPEIPSAALLISYSMLFYPNWLANGYKENLVPVARPVEDFVGGVENTFFPLLFNTEMAMIALAVGRQADLWDVHYSVVLGTVLINPNLNNPLVKETQKRIVNDGLGFTQARDLFIELLKQEEYKGNIPLADDYVANAKFIEEASASVDSDANAKIEEAMQVDFKDTFGKVIHQGEES